MNGYLVDTNVISELVKHPPNENVYQYVSQIPLGKIFISSLTIYEIAYGISRMPMSKKRALLDRQTKRLIQNMQHLAFAKEDVHETVNIATKARAEGTPLDDHIIDTMLAGTAKHHDLTILTRNEAEFTAAGVPFVNPWRSE
ncbi:MAG: PIN domain-containing protein [Pseudomonadota bacterium]